MPFEAVHVEPGNLPLNPGHHLLLSGFRPLPCTRHSPIIPFSFAFPTASPQDRSSLSHPARLRIGSCGSENEGFLAGGATNAHELPQSLAVASALNFSTHSRFSRPMQDGGFPGSFSVLGVLSLKTQLEGHSIFVCLSAIEQTASYGVKHHVRINQFL